MIPVTRIRVRVEAHVRLTQLQTIETAHAQMGSVDLTVWV